MTDKEMKKLKNSLPKWDEQNEEEKKLDRELDCRDMINSILIYGYLNNTVDEIYENKYLRNYKKDISEARIKELIKEQQDDLKKSKINSDVYIDGEGVSYNSVTWYDGDEDVKEESLFNKSKNISNADISDFNANLISNNEKMLNKLQLKNENSEDSFVELKALDEYYDGTDFGEYTRLVNEIKLQSEEKGYNLSDEDITKIADKMVDVDGFFTDYKLPESDDIDNEGWEEIHNVIDNYINEMVFKKRAQLNESYKIYSIQGGDGVYNSVYVGTVETEEQAIDRVAELEAETGNGAWYEKVDEWWENNYQRAINYVENETPEVVVGLFGYGDKDDNAAWDMYNSSTAKSVAVELLNYLGEEEFEKVLDEYEKSLNENLRLNKEVKKSKVTETIEDNQYYIDRLNELKNQYKSGYGEDDEEIKQEVIRLLDEIPNGFEAYRVSKETNSGWTAYGSYHDEYTVLVPFRKNNDTWTYRFREGKDSKDAAISVLGNSGEFMTKEEAEAKKKEQEKDDVSYHRDIVNVGKDQWGNPIGKSTNRIDYTNRKDESKELRKYNEQDLSKDLFSKEANKRIYNRLQNLDIYLEEYEQALEDNDESRIEIAKSKIMGNIEYLIPALNIKGGVSGLIEYIKNTEFDFENKFKDTIDTLNYFAEEYKKLYEKKELRKYNSRLYGIYDTEKEEYEEVGSLEDMKEKIRSEKDDIKEEPEKSKEDKKDININITVKNENKEKLSFEEIVLDSYQHLLNEADKKITLENLFNDIINNYEQDYIKDDTIEDMDSAFRSIVYVLNHNNIKFELDENIIVKNEGKEMKTEGYKEDYERARRIIDDLGVEKVCNKLGMDYGIEFGEKSKLVKWLATMSDREMQDYFPEYVDKIEEMKTEGYKEESVEPIINPEDRFYKDEHLYRVLIYPGVGVEMIPYYVYADYEQDALEILVPYLLDNAPGLVYDIQGLEEEFLDDYITVDGIHYLDYNTKVEELFGNEKDKIETEFFKNYKEEE